MINIKQGANQIYFNHSIENATGYTISITNILANETRVYPFIDSSLNIDYSIWNVSATTNSALTALTYIPEYFQGQNDYAIASGSTIIERGILHYNYSGYSYTNTAFSADNNTTIILT